MAPLYLLPLTLPHKHREEKTMSRLFESFVGKQVKVPYSDGNHLKVARGTLEDVNNNFIRVRGNLGVIVINTRNIEKLTEIV